MYVITHLHTYRSFALRSRPRCNKNALYSSFSLSDTHTAMYPCIRFLLSKCCWFSFCGSRGPRWHRRYCITNAKDLDLTHISGTFTYTLFYKIHFLQFSTLLLDTPSSPLSSVLYVHILLSSSWIVFERFLAAEMDANHRQAKASLLRMGAAVSDLEF